ncbi:similar to Saccharomyces cerevisiae YDR118W APC4 Subunit of the Anaphase-Promoting Complex/Cyclosome (APC/C) [Maudiozyma barnettii]|uniref:Similar to Saccharomyces cerevisiae YDR118W APC4 Subunit of the Anaphase-Promoting Complex/Cyclosome (APC/C) n=1 Tax=Maudiozyma barnettii TaxID=61262 RepID=A0A8H2VHE1_9SACH|nr:anaphase promoting complex subunit 4 [Kazachstania barnettii]CAB4255709.1 similar to Saccharomyces cerevisiae YDR118W APC4 Subunit of the Anaphase-Promoting Complex/Cyclosome (APC/C) [Kazachstania barnettii]CAD1784270.1 similar to Saccharomyces cerevisiae YDR118W APC4 Subunit of the Anaphase-Promoting Complex/Cyclosome (APC/C) [Kazachstania barnettii]
MSEEEFYRIEDPEQDLYLTRQGKSIIVKRRSDDQQISSTYIRDWTQLVGCHWDTILGRYLSIMFNDGSIRLIDTNDNGKLISFMRTGLTNSDSSYWSRLLVNTSNKGIKIMNISESFPNLTKFSMENETIKFEPFDLVSKKWRKIDNDPINEKKGNKRQVLDFHIMHSGLNDEVSFILNGSLSLKTMNNGQGQKVCKIINEDSGIYQFWYSEGHRHEIDLSLILGNNNNMSLLHDIIEFQELIQYLKTNITFLHDKIIKPYTDFLEKITNVSYDRLELYDDLNQLIFTGEVEETLADWLKYTIGERNIQTWRDKSSKMYENGSEVLQLGIINAFERVFISLERISGSLSLLFNNNNNNNNTISDDEDGTQFESQLAKLYELFKIMFKTTHEIISTNNRSRRIIKHFLDWLEDKVREVNKTDNDANNNEHKNKNLDYFDEATTVPHIKEGLKLVCFSSNDNDNFFFISKEFNGILNEITQIVTTEIINISIIPKFESFLIQKDYHTIFPHEDNLTSFELLDIATMNIASTSPIVIGSSKDVSIMVYKRTAQQQGEVDHIFIGTLYGSQINLSTFPLWEVQAAHLTPTQLYSQRIKKSSNRFNLILQVRTASGVIEYLPYIFEIRQHSRGNNNIVIGIRHQNENNDNDHPGYTSDWFAQNFSIEQIYPELTTEQQNNINATH